MEEKFQHKKSLGQHFLNSDYVSKKMCEAANLHEGEVVLEIGPGTGMLTKELLAGGVKVVAIETDQRAVESLEETFPEEIASGQLTLHHHDARVLNPSDFGLKTGEYKVVSNIPYYLSSSLFRQMLDTDTQPKTLVFLVQKEVAERIARSKKESLLSLSVKVFGEPSYICTVKKSHFTPPPKIDSAIIAVEGISRRNFSEISPTDFFTVLHLGFGQKRKQLLGNLSAKFPRSQVEDVFAELNIEKTIRAEDLPLSTWLILTKQLFPQ